jgi:hypothetical protein
MTAERGVGITQPATAGTGVSGGSDFALFV